MSKITIDTAVLEHVLEWFEWFHNAPNLISKHSSNRVHEGLREALAQPQPVQESEYCDPSSTIYKLAEMVMSDCGCSSDHQRLLDRIAARIQSHIDTTQQPAQPLPVQPTANSGDADTAVLDRMAKYVSTITQSEIDEADGDRGITKGTT